MVPGLSLSLSEWLTKPALQYTLHTPHGRTKSTKLNLRFLHARVRALGKVRDFKYMIKYEDIELFSLQTSRVSKQESIELLTPSDPTSFTTVSVQSSSTLPALPPTVSVSVRPIWWEMLSVVVLKVASWRWSVPPFVSTQHDKVDPFCRSNFSYLKDAWKMVLLQEIYDTISELSLARPWQHL